MLIELKQAIVNFIFAHAKSFNLVNLTTEAFRPYIYSGSGDYLIGGETVKNFINDAVKLITE